MSGLTLDEVDGKILSILMNNSRVSISDIARELGLSRPTVRKRIKRLVDSGVIKSFSIVVDENLLRGFQILCFFRAPNVEETVGKLRNLSEVSEIYITTGEKNILCIARIADLKNLENLLREFKKYGIPFEVDIVLHTEKKAMVFPPFKGIKVTCDYCGSEITGKPMIYRIHNRTYYLCCPTCYREFSKKMKRITG